jgi:hypothetical protein
MPTSNTVINGAGLRLKSLARRGLSAQPVSCAPKTMHLLSRGLVRLQPLEDELI